MAKLNRKRRSKSMDNKKYKRKRKRTIKLNRKFNKKRTRRRRRKQRGGEGGFLSGITGFFTKKNEDKYLAQGQPGQPGQPGQQGQLLQVANPYKDVKDPNPAVKQTGTYLGRIGDGLGKMGENLKNGLARATNVADIMKKPDVQQLDRSAMNDFQKLQTDFQKILSQFENMNKWINSRASDPTKCPCCKRPLDKVPQGKGQEIKVGENTPQTQTPNEMNNLANMQNMNDQSGMLAKM